MCKALEKIGGCNGELGLMVEQDPEKVKSREGNEGFSELFREAARVAFTGVTKDGQIVVPPSYGGPRF